MRVVAPSLTQQLAQQLALPQAEIERSRENEHLARLPERRFADSVSKGCGRLGIAGMAAHGRHAHIRVESQNPRARLANFVELSQRFRPLRSVRTQFGGDDKCW